MDGDSKQGRIAKVDIIIYLSIRRIPLQLPLLTLILTFLSKRTKKGAYLQ